MLKYDKAGVYTANQPLLFPSVYMINRYAHCSDLVVMEEAQFTKFGHQSRVEVVVGGELKYITVPLQDRDFKPINQVRLHQPQKMLHKLTGTLQAAYGRYPMFKYFRDSLFHAMEVAAQMDNLSDFNTHLLRWLFLVLEFDTQIHLSTQLLPQRPSDPSKWVADLGAALVAKTYLGGETAQQAYIDERDFWDHGIILQPQKYKMPMYHSGPLLVGALPRDGWVSILDVLFTQEKEMRDKIIYQPPYEGAYYGTSDQI